MLGEIRGSFGPVDTMERAIRLQIERGSPIDIVAET
jgi:hypothetical protein